MDQQMTPREYAAYSKVSLRTVERWLASGLPRLQRGPREVVRIIPRVADAWRVGIT